MSIIRSLKKSWGTPFTLEITTTLGCPVNCFYCPQELLKKNGKGRKKKLVYSDFVKAINNIDIRAEIHWTGYSEPCLSSDLEEMVRYVSIKKLPQYISTTLSGFNESVEFLINSKDFYAFQLHLPDNAGLMKGLRVDESYVDRVRRCLQVKYEQGLASTITLTCFGDDYHPLIKDVVKPWETMRGGCGTKIYSRAGSLDMDKMKEYGLRGFSSYENQSSKSDSPNYFCNRQKLNSPVLIPDGSLSICSFDYGLRMTYGNLFTDKLSDIYKKWILKVSPSFNRGTLSPCTECEQYDTY